MSEQKAELIGRGGGMGKYQGMTLTEIEASFARCEADPSMRSVNAVLRICREQLEARGSLGSYPWIATIFSGVLVVGLGLQFTVVPEAMQMQGMTVLGALSFMVAALWYGVARVAHDRSAAVVQEAEIRRMAVTSLLRLVEQDFVRKPLEREKEQTLRELLRRDPRPELQSLLDG